MRDLKMRQIIIYLFLTNLVLVSCSSEEKSKSHQSDSGEDVEENSVEGETTSLQLAPGTVTHAGTHFFISIPEDIDHQRAVQITVNNQPCSVLSIEKTTINCKMNSKDLYTFTGAKSNWKQAAIQINYTSVNGTSETKTISNVNLESDQFSQDIIFNSNDIETRVINEIREYFNIDSQSKDFWDRFGQYERWMTSKYGNLFFKENLDTKTHDLFLVDNNFSNISNPIKIISFKFDNTSIPSRVSYYYLFSKIKGITDYDPSRIEITDKGIVGLDAPTHEKVQYQVWKLKLNQNNEVIIDKKDRVDFCKDYIKISGKYNNFFKQSSKCEAALIGNTLRVFELTRQKNTHVLYADKTNKVIPNFFSSTMTQAVNPDTPTIVKFHSFLNKLKVQLTYNLKTTYLIDPEINLNGIKINGSSCIFYETGCVVSNIDSDNLNYTVEIKNKEQIIATGIINVKKFEPDVDKEYEVAVVMRQTQYDTTLKKNITTNNLMAGPMNYVSLPGPRVNSNLSYYHIPNIKRFNLQSKEEVNLSCDVPKVVIGSKSVSVDHNDINKFNYYQCRMDNKAFDMFDKDFRFISIETDDGQVINTKEAWTTMKMVPCTNKFDSSFCFRNFTYSNTIPKEDNNCEKACLEHGGFLKDKMTKNNCKRLAEITNCTFSANNSSNTLTFCQKEKTTFKTGDYKDRRIFLDKTSNFCTCNY